MGTKNPGFIKSAAGVNATLLYAGPCNLKGLSLHSTNSYAIYLHVYDLARKPIVGVDVPVTTFQIAQITQPPTAPTFEEGIPFVNGLAYSITKAVGDTDATPVLLNDLIGYIDYTTRTGQS